VFVLVIFKERFKHVVNANKQFSINISNLSPMITNPMMIIMSHLFQQSITLRFVFRTILTVNSDYFLKQR
jgi:hypothetical protein